MLDSTIDTLRVEYLDGRTHRWFAASQAATIGNVTAFRVDDGAQSGLHAVAADRASDGVRAQRRDQRRAGPMTRRRVKARRGVALLAALWLVVAIAAVALQFSLEARERRTIGLLTSERGMQRGLALGALALVQARLDQALRGGTVDDQQSGTRAASLRAIRGSTSTARSAARWTSTACRSTSWRTTSARSSTSTRPASRSFARSSASCSATSQGDPALAGDSWIGATRTPFRVRAAPSATRTSEAEMLALPTNVPFRDVADLQDVMGMTPEIYAKASPYLTTRGTDQVNLNTAPVPVLRALTGMTDATLNTILQLRSQGRRIKDVRSGVHPADGRWWSWRPRRLALQTRCKPRSAFGRSRRRHRSIELDHGARWTAGTADQADRHRQPVAARARDSHHESPMVKPTARLAARRRTFARGSRFPPTELCAADIRLRNARRPRLARAARSAAGRQRPLAVAHVGARRARAYAWRHRGHARRSRSCRRSPKCAGSSSRRCATKICSACCRAAHRATSSVRAAPQIVGASLAGRRVRGAPTPVIAAAAPARLIAAIRHAAQQTGWTVEVIAPAEGAWASAALELWPVVRATAVVRARRARRSHRPSRRSTTDRLVGVRRFRAGAARCGDDRRHGWAGRARRSISGRSRRARSSAARSRRLASRVLVPSGEWSSAADGAEVLAAHFAGSELGPVLRSEDALIAERANARKTRAWQVAGAAAALFVVAAGVELWGVHHQLDLVRERARAHSAGDRVDDGRAARPSMRRIVISPRSVAIERTSPRWSSVIATLSDALPDDAYLTGGSHARRFSDRRRPGRSRRACVRRAREGERRLST